MSMWAEYLKERENTEVFETSDGFVTYKYLNDGILYVVDIYVPKSKRQLNVASRMADELAKIAKEKGFKTMLGSVCLDANGADTSIKVLHGYGMKFSHYNGNMLYFTKEL